MQHTFIAGAAILALHGAALAGGEGWSSDFAASKKLAVETKKDLLIDFTGSDWCSWCIKLNDEVFKHEPFKAGVKDSFVLVELDYPRDKSKLSEATQKQNEELGKKYAVQGYPTILLCEADGRPYAATGYQQGGPEKYVEHLNELRGNKAKRDEAFAKAATIEGVDKAKALIAALEALELDDALVAGFYGDIVGQIKAADPKDETGFTKQAAAKQRLADFQEQLQGFGRKRDHEGALALVDKTLKEGGFDAETTQQMIMTRAVILAELKKFDEALKAIDEAKAAAPDSQMAGMIDGFREQIETRKKDAAAPPADKPEDKPADKPEGE
jgi:thioredoxin-related protein